MLKFKCDIDPGVIRTPWVYFDGAAEDVCEAQRIQTSRSYAPDYCGVFVGNEEPDERIHFQHGRAILPIGSYPVTVYEEPAQAFVWRDMSVHPSVITGLIILISDAKRLTWARKNYKSWRRSA
jgi:hypothetical protein